MKAKPFMTVILAGLAFASAAFGSPVLYRFAALAGSANALTLATPLAIARDHKGNLYVSDMTTPYTGNGIIYKISADQSSYSVFASSLAYPAGLAFDSKGNLFVADYSAITEITPQGTVSTYAGAQNSFGDRDGNRLSARFLAPNRITIGTDDTIYFFDNGKMKKIDPSGNVTTMAGSVTIDKNGNPVGVVGFVDGQGSSAQFGHPVGIAADTLGNVFIADNGALRKMTPDGTVTTTDRFLSAEAGICVDTMGSVYVTSSSATWIDVFDSQGHWNRAAGPSAPYDSLSGITIDPNGVLYAVNNSNSTGRVVTVGTLATQTVANGRIMNLSARGYTGSGSNTFIVGFVTNGAIPVQLRGIGPGLLPYNVFDFVPNPRLEVHAPAGDVIDGNEDWDGLQTTSARFSQLGAFPLTVGSKDAALYRTINGLNTVFVLGDASGDGEVLAEAYDASASTGPVTDPSTPRLVNISSRGRIPSGGQMIVGFVISGAPRKVLIRATGKTLENLGVTGALPDAKLTLFDKNSVAIASNDNWAGDVVIQTAASTVHAFDWAANSTDAALVVTLDPGSYTAVVTGNNGASGAALVEVYEMP